MQFCNPRWFGRILSNSLPNSQQLNQNNWLWGAVAQRKEEATGSPLFPLLLHLLQNNTKHTSLCIECLLQHHHPTSICSLPSCLPEISMEAVATPALSCRALAEPSFAIKFNYILRLSTYSVQRTTTTSNALFGLGLGSCPNGDSCAKLNVVILQWCKYLHMTRIALDKQRINNFRSIY